MNKLMDFLGGLKLVEKVTSPVNGKIEVFKSFAFGTYIQVGGLTQTGGVVNDVWKTALKKVKDRKIEKCLILGLGGGGNAGIVRKFWPDTRITGIDLDPKMVEMGKKYFNLDALGVNVVISDAFDFVNKKKSLRAFSHAKNENFDLILIDLYKGSEFPKKFEGADFPEMVSKNLKLGGIAIFNRLYYGEKRRDAVNFLGKLEKIFSKVDVVYPEANVMYICHS